MTNTPTPVANATGKIYSLPTGPNSTHQRTVVESGHLSDLRPTYVQLVGKNPDRANVGYLLIADHDGPLECANTFAV